MGDACAENSNVLLDEDALGVLFHLLGARCAMGVGEEGSFGPVVEDSGVGEADG